MLDFDVSERLLKCYRYSTPSDVNMLAACLMNEQWAVSAKNNCLFVRNIEWSKQYGRVNNVTCWRVVTDKLSPSIAAESSIIIKQIARIYSMMRYADAVGIIPRLWLVVHPFDPSVSLMRSPWMLYESKRLYGTGNKWSIRLNVSEGGRGL